jgi:hypothetical protein
VCAGVVLEKVSLIFCLTLLILFHIYSIPDFVSGSMLGGLVRTMVRLNSLASTIGSGGSLGGLVRTMVHLNSLAS